MSRLVQSEVYEVKDIIRKAIPLHEAKQLPVRRYKIHDGRDPHRTNYQEEYPAKDARPADSLRVEDNINFGDLRVHTTTYKKNYNTPLKGEGQLAAKMLNDHQLESRIKTNNTQDHIQNLQQFYQNPDGVPKEYTSKPASFVKPKQFDRKFKLQGNSVYDESYRAHSQPKPDPFSINNNLSVYKNAKAGDLTEYRREHSSKSPHAHKATTALYEQNRYFGRSSNMSKSPDVKKSTNYDSHYNKRGEAKHGGADSMLNHALHSYYNAYYHENVK